MSLFPAHKDAPSVECTRKLSSLLVALVCCLALVMSSVPLSACSSESQEQENPLHNTDIGCGWTVERTMDLSYATQFSVDYFEDGFKLICLSDGSRFLVVPEGGAVPSSPASDVTVLQQPLDNMYLAASDTMCLFDALKSVDTICVSGIKKEDWHVSSAVEAMDKGAMIYGGKYNAPDYDLLLEKHIDLAIESTMINHVPEVRDKLVEVGIPVLTEHSSQEDEPLGRSEWIKLYGVLLNEEDLANKVFLQQEKQVKAVEGANTGKTVAFFYINSNGAAVVRRPGDYVTKMISIAGGSYIFKSLEGDDTARSTVTMEMEKFYAEARNADVIIYNSTIDGGVKSIDDLVAKNGLLENFKAVKSGAVWCTEQDMYQQMIHTGSIIADFNTVLTSDDSSKLQYLKKLK